MTGVELHDGEPVHDGQVDDGPVPPRRAVAFEMDRSTTLAFDRRFAEGVGQVVIYMTPQHQGSQPIVLGNDCLVLRIDEVLPLVHWLVDAYGRRLEGTVWDLAAGGCRTCRNRRRVHVPFDPADVECPACTPRAEQRIRDRLWFRHWPRRSRP